VRSGYPPLQRCTSTPRISGWVEFILLITNSSTDEHYLAVPIVVGAGGRGGGLWLQAPSPKIALAIVTATRTLTKGIEYSLLSLLVARGILSNPLQLTTKICFTGSRRTKKTLCVLEKPQDFRISLICMPTQLVFDYYSYGIRSKSFWRQAMSG
jgi:hypothetical protein